MDFLKIDVEGFEGEVIKGNDWKKYRPNIVVIEANHKSTDWTKQLEDAEYVKVFHDGLNDYFASREYYRKIDFSKYPELITEGPLVVDWPLKSHINELIAKKDEIKHKYDTDEQIIAYARKHPIRFFVKLLQEKYTGKDLW